MLGVKENGVGSPEEIHYFAYFQLNTTNLFRYLKGPKIRKICVLILSKYKKGYFVGGGERDILTSWVKTSMLALMH